MNVQHELNVVQDKEMIPFLEYNQYAKDVVTIQTKNGKKHKVKFVEVGTMHHYGIMTVFDCLGEDGKIYGSIAISPRKEIIGPVVNAVSQKNIQWDRHSLARVRLMNIIDTVMNEQQTIKTNGR